MQKIIISILLIMNVLHQESYAADNSLHNLKNPQIIPLIKGLLTKVPCILLKEKSQYEGFFQDISWKIIIQKNKDERLADIISDQKLTFTGPSPASIFYASLIKIKKDGTLVNCGTFKRGSHASAVEALRVQQGAFYPYRQGVILYWNSPDKNVNDIKTQVQQIQKIADQNFPTRLSYNNLPIYYRS